MNKNHAEIFRIGTVTGFIDFQSIIDWADQEIMEGQEDNDIIEISTAKDINDLISILKGVVGIPEPRVIINNFFSILRTHFEKRTNDIKVITRTLYYILMEYSDSLTEHESSNINYFDDGYDLAVLGTYGTISTIRAELGVFLSNYRKPYGNIFDKIIIRSL